MHLDIQSEIRINKFQLEFKYVFLGEMDMEVKQDTHQDRWCKSKQTSFINCLNVYTIV